MALDKLKYHTISEASQQGVALETGVVDVVIQMDLTTAPQYIDNAEYVVEQTTAPRTILLRHTEDRAIFSILSQL